MQGIALQDVALRGAQPLQGLGEVQHVLQILLAALVGQDSPQGLGLALGPAPGAILSDRRTAQDGEQPGQHPAFVAQAVAGFPGLVKGLLSQLHRQIRLRRHP
jgi:hypothetical protein